MIARSAVDGPATERRFRRSRAHPEDPSRVAVHVCGSGAQPEGRVGVQQRRVRGSGVRAQPVPRTRSHVLQRRVQRAHFVRDVDTGTATSRVSGTGDQHRR